VSDFGDLPCSEHKTNAGQCPNPPTTGVTVGCVHEHIRPGRVCDEHLQQLNDREMHCYDCFYGDDSHRCPVIGRVMV
jgi:hypothetical protein